MDPHAKRNTMSIDDVLDDVWRGAKKKRRRHAGAKPAAPAATDADAASAAARRLRADAHLRHAEEKREIAILLARPPRAFPAPDAPPPPRAAEAQMRDDDAAQMQDAATGDGAAAAQDDGATGDDGAAEDDGAARDGAVSDEGPAALPGGGAPSPPLGGCASSPERGDCGAAELASREGSPERGDPAAEPSPKRQKCPADDGVARCGTDDAIGALRRLRDEAPPRDSLDGFALPDSLSRGAALPAAPAAPAARRSDAAGAVPRPQGSVPKDDSHGLPKDCSHGSVATDCSVPTEFEHGGGPTPFSQPYSAREAPRASAPCISQVLSGAWTTQASRSQASLLGVDDRDDEAPFESPAVVVEAWDARRRAVVLGLFADERDAHRDEVLRIAKMMASRESTLRLASQAATIGVARGLLERPPQPRTRRVRSDAAEGAAGVAVSAAAAAAAESATGDGAVMKKPVARSATAVDAAPPRRPVARAATTDAAPPRPPAAERIPAEKGALPAAKVPLVKALFVKKPVKKFGTKAAVPAPAARPAALFAGVNAVLVYKRTSKVAVANVGRKFAAQGGRLLGVFSADGDGCAGEVGEALKNGATHIVVDAADCFDASAESSGDFEEEDGCKTPAEVVLNHAATGASIEVLRLNWLTSSLGEQRLLAAQHFVVSVPPPAKKKRASLVAAKKCTSRADYVQSQAGKKLFACQILPQGARPDDAWKAERSAADGALDGADGAWNGAPAEGAAAKAGNANIIDWLTELVLFYNGSSDLKQVTWSAPCMERTIKKIQLLPYSLTADHIPLLQGILGKKQGGEATVSKLTELILTGKLRRVEQWRLDPSRKAMRDLVRVHGIGPTTAAKLVAKGVSSVQDLKLRLDRGEKNIDVSACVKTGLLRFDDLQLRIPRDEVRDVERAVFEAAQRVMQRTAAASTGDSPDEPAATAVTALAVGSYRRGAASCGDVDILITSELWRSSFQDEANCQSVKVQRKTFLNHLLDDLEQSGFLTDRLASAARYDTKKAGPKDFDVGPATFMGVCKPRSLHRRVDIKVYAPEHWAYAILYFTGSGHFNRSMRAYAKALGMSLCDTSLKKVLRRGSARDAAGGYLDNKVASLESFPATTEKDVFDHLRLDWREPHERSCVDSAAAVGLAAERLRRDKNLAADFFTTDDADDHADVA